MTRYLILAALIAALTTAGVTLANDEPAIHVYSTLAECPLMAVPSDKPQDGGSNPPIIFTIPAGVEVEVIPPGSIVRMDGIDFLNVQYAGEEGWMDWACLDVYQGTPDIGTPPVAGTPEPTYPIAVEGPYVVRLPGTGTGETA